MTIRRVLSLLPAAVAILGFLVPNAPAQSNVTVRIMAANLNGNIQSIQPFAIDIYKGLKPDVVCVQEFNYSNNAAADFRALVDDAFGTNFSYYRESGSLQIPNGIISRYPILASGRWVDTQVSNRGFAWARIDLPGSNDLYAVSVHLLTTSSGNRTIEANNLKALIQSNFPANAWIVIAGDFNTTSRGETAITTFATLCPDSPIPTDAEIGGDSDSNANRNNPYDYVLASTSLTNYLTNAVFTSHSFARGLVFDSRVYTPLSDVTPIVLGDSGQAQHMAVLKDFSIPVSGSNAPVAPVIATQPQSQTVSVASTANFSVAATGTTPLAYQWRFNGTNISGAQTNTYSIVNAQTTNNGGYTVIITNVVGSVTSSVATLTVSNVSPAITTNPAPVAAFIGDTVAFSVTATGTAPLAYQWRFNTANISGATNEDYTFNNAQTNNAGNYTVIVTNSVGSVTSAIAVLTVSNATPFILTNPAPVTVTVGGTANFSVVADGGTPLEYQWRFNGADIGGANLSTYSLSNAQTNNAGNYTVVVTNIVGSVTSAVAALTVTLPSTNSFTGVLAGWNMTGVTGYGSSPMAPTTNAPNLTVVGLTRGSGVTTINTAATGAWGGNGFGSMDSATAITNGDFATLALTANSGFKISFGNVSAFNYRRSSASAPPSGLLQFQIGTNAFTDITNVAYASTSSSGATLPPIDLSTITALQDIGPGTNVTFRIVNYGTNVTGGNWYIFDVGASAALDFAITGTVAPVAPPSGPPAIAPTLTTPQLAGNQFIFQLTGTAASNYVVQVSTNLATNNWLPLQTNAAPFWFTNPIGQPQQFFRGQLAP